MHSTAAVTCDRVPTTLRDLRGVQPPRLNPGRAAVVIIDAQAEYAEGPLALEGLSQAVREIGHLRDWARRRAVPVIHVRQEAPAGAPVFAVGGRGAEFLPQVRPAKGELVVTKTYPNAFRRTDLEDLLHQLRRDQLILAGFMTHMCVDSTARAAFDRDYKVFVVACATADRAIPGTDGSVVPAHRVRAAALAALNDRFAWIIPSALDLEGAVSG